jgi:ubiquinone/menaquinone biosynthesis C-methylase UbiE
VFYKQRLLERCENVDVLEYGCGPGSSAFLLAGHVTNVVGIDISEVAIVQAEKEARREGLRNVTFEVMNAEELRFPNDSFDMICGSAILHHLDLRKAFSELARTLKPGGSALFVEPLGHNPAINFYRALTPKLRTVDEHPLLMKDLKLAREYFDGVEVRFFQFLTFAAIPFRGFPFRRRLRLALDHYDQGLFRRFSYMKRHALQVVIELSKPRKSRTGVGLGVDAFSRQGG